MREAGARYQRGPVGREKHRVRTERYRIRKQALVTHQSSPFADPAVTLGAAAPEEDTPPPASEPSCPGEEVASDLDPVIAAKDEPHDDNFAGPPAVATQFPASGARVHCWMCGRPCLSFARFEFYRCRARPFGRKCRERAGPRRDQRPRRGR